MGTRGLVGFVVDGDVKATYNHFDSYPDGLGVAVLNWVSRIANQHEPEALKRVRDLRVVEGESTPSDEDIERLLGYSDIGVSTGAVTEWYVLLRETQGDIAKILDAGVIIDSTDFASDSLFCEWGYLVNFDERTIEVYRGFQTEEHTDGRFASDQHSKVSSFSGDVYYPIRLIATFGFDTLPDDGEFVHSVELLGYGDDGE